MQSPDRLTTLLRPEALAIRTRFQRSADCFWKEQLAAKHRLANELSGVVRGPVRAQLGELAADLGRTAYLLLDAHSEFVLGLPEEFHASLNAPPPADEMALKVIRDPRDAAYVIGFKSFFLFLRAYQDVAWVLIREVMEGQKLAVGKGAGSMSKAFACETAARTHLLANLPGYERWFHDWRALRNHVKIGVNFGIREVQTDPGVTFMAMRDLPDNRGLALGGEGDRIVRLRELADALGMMKSLATAVRTAPVP